MKFLKKQKTINRFHYLITTTMISLLYIDLFCGAGGTSTGVSKARLFGQPCAKVVACVNHDANAIASHQANHPDTLHFTEDIRTLDLRPLVAHLQKERTKYPQARVVLWASLECTNFSKAKGGQPRDADSRTLAEHLFRYIDAINPHFIQIENVEEFMCWGDLDAFGKPISKDKGRCYLNWVRNVCCYGYDFDYRILNAADFGAYTSRKRFFGQFAKHGLPITFPKPSYAKFGDEDSASTAYKKWKPVREVLDLNDEGESIFCRRKPLVEKTLERIYAGLVKFVAGGKDNFLVRYNSVRPQDTVKGIDEPCGVLTCGNRFAKAKAQFISKQFSGHPMSKNQSIDLPAGTITTIPHEAFITAYYGNGFNADIQKPMPTVLTKDRFGLVNINLNEPMPDVPLDKVRIQASHFLANEYSGGGQVGSIETANPAVLCIPKQKLVSADRYLMNPQFESAGGSIEKPCFTLIARMDKMPPYLIYTEQGELGIAVYNNDSPMTRKIKEFMSLYGIIDIKMRMLNIRELKRIMGFPEDYVLIGNQSEQKKYIGNAVEVNMSRVLCESLAASLEALNQKTA